jgi:outer membrane receptor protein involved in Fe transport
MTKPTSTRTRRWGARASLAVIAASFGATAAWAEEAPRAADSATAVETVVVTARKREERVVDVPFALQVLTGDKLQKLGAVNFGDYARTVAGVQFEDKGAGRANIFMRGVSTGGDVDTGKESTVGVYFDETPIAESSSQPDLKLFDIDHLEVLRGPQGTLFGSGALSGALRILPRQPVLGHQEAFLEGQVSGTRYGGFNDSVDGMINAPLGDKAALRVVGYLVQNDGFLDNGFSGADNVNFEHSYGGRAALRLQPTEKLDLTLTGIYQHSHFGAYYQATDHYPDLIIDQAEPEPFTDRYFIGTLKANYDLGGAKLTSVTSYFDRNRYFQNDIDYFTGLIGLPQAFSPLTYPQKVFTQELRLASEGDRRLTWVGGLFFEDLKESATQTISPAGQPVPPPAQQLAYIHRDTRTRQYAAFGEASYKITPQLSFTAGLRASLIKGSNTSDNNGVLFGGESIKTGTDRDTPVTPRFILSYKPNENAQIYVQAARGFRIGGVNPGLPPCQPANGCTVDVGTSFGPDSVWNYELGTKLITLDGRLSFDADVFFIDWTDIQVNVGRGDGFNGFMNAGAAHTKGAELSANAQVNEHLRVGGQFTYTEGHLVSLAPGVAASGVAQVGDALPQIPKIATSGYAELGTGFGADGWVYLRGDVQYVDKRLSNFSSSAPRTLPSYTTVNLRLGVDKGPWSGAVFVNNVTDERAILSDQAYGGVHNGLPYFWNRDNINTPRTVGVQLSRRF